LGEEKKSDADDDGRDSTKVQAFTSVVMSMKIGNICYLYYRLTKSTCAYLYSS